MEQTRWVLGGLLEIQDLRPLWPLRVVLDPAAPANPKFSLHNGQYLLVCQPKSPVPLDQVTRLLLDANTPRLPQDIESGLPQLFTTLDVHGSHVNWGGPVAHPDLAYARLQLFATRFEYKASFHIFLTSLKNGSTLQAAERNAFGVDPAKLEAQARENLASGNFQPDAVSGRPLDPKRDFGVHSASNTAVEAYIADSELDSNPHAAEQAYKAAVQAGGADRALGYAGLAALAERDGQNPVSFDEQALNAGSLSPEVFLQLARYAPPAEALELLKRAAKLNPKWALPVYRESEMAKDPIQKEALLKQAADLDPRKTQYWIELAQLQAADGHAIEARNSWVRAEDSAPTQAERAHIDQMREAAEQARLDAADAERRREEDAVREEDRRAQDAEAARIRAAEEKANRQLDAEAGGAAPEKVVPWDELASKKNLTGVLIRVDCSRAGKRLTVKERSGKTSSLLAAGPPADGLACGVQEPSRRVLIRYAAEPDDTTRTIGRVLTLKFPE